MINKITRNYYNNKDYFLDEENKVVKLSTEFHKKLLSAKPGSFNGFKKVGGSSIANVLNLDALHNDFVAFCNISKIGLPILDKKYVNAGIILEPEIIKMLEQKTNKIVERFPAQKYNYDYFKDNLILGGLPDGYIESTNTIVEIKTTGLKNYEYWQNNGIPLNYIKQTQLYAYLKGANSYAICASFLEEADYQNLDKVDVFKRKSMVQLYKLNKEQAEDDIEKVYKWYKKYTELGISPTYDLAMNLDLIEWLRCENQEQWEQLYNKWFAEGKINLYEV
ncbi:MAGa7180 family putative nuclease [Mycoplasma miroungirhinis]|uniref:YqaJ viral recombinase domain-containing protein n=1 Tax=Mycoplasma miroungirhinis TaxID=754516 RepID=A0A6M4JCU8_9MOLU|nr:YqaJ viral recombinase family protein [Mycoplasma miroungirhinis]QJR43897.1 hypothetical protein HLA92_00250 [Mycoplasma miroungirhinis]